MPINNNTATLNNIITKNKEQIDKTITTIFKSPKSYTGEDMVEISIHGGPAIISKIVEALTEKVNDLSKKLENVTRHSSFL